MAILHFLIGIPGSGKSTFAKQLHINQHAVIVSSDTIRNLHPDWAEEKIFPEVRRLCAMYLKENQDVIYDATNINKKVREEAIEEIKSHYADFEIYAYYFVVSRNQCIERVKKRNKNPNERYLPLAVVSYYFKIIEPPVMEEGFTKIMIKN